MCDHVQFKKWLKVMCSLAFDVVLVTPKILSLEQLK